MHRIGESQEGKITISEFLKRGGYSANTIYKHFDSFYSALQEADLNAIPESEASKSSKDDREAMLKILRSLHDRLDRVPQANELPEDCEYSQHDFYTEFGSWDEALTAGGVDKEQSMLNEIERVAEKLQRVPTTSDMQENGAYSDYSSFFSSWSTAIEKSEVEENLQKNPEKDKELLNILVVLQSPLEFSSN